MIGAINLKLIFKRSPVKDAPAAVPDSLREHCPINSNRTSPSGQVRVVLIDLSLLKEGRNQKVVEEGRWAAGPAVVAASAEGRWTGGPSIRKNAMPMQMPYATRRDGERRWAASDEACGRPRAAVPSARFFFFFVAFQNDVRVKTQ